MDTKRPAERLGRSASAVSAWPLRRKVALALAIPLLLAGTLGGLRVGGDLVEASNSSASAQQVTALRPAVEYLTAAEEAMIAAVGTEAGDDAKNQAALEQALADIRAAAEELRDSKDSAGLTDEQRYQVDAVMDLSQAMRATDAETLSAGTWVAQLRQLHSGVTQLITTIVNEQINPEPRLELLSQALTGRFSLAMQQALAATERTGEAGSLELFSEFGVEGAAIDRLASSQGVSGEAVASLRTANAQRFREVRTGGTDLGGAGAYADYDAIISSLQEGIDDGLEAAAAEARSDALLNAGVTLLALLVAVLLALLVSRLLINPIRRVREGALAVAHERLPEAVARIRAGEAPGEITPIDVTTEEEIGQLARAVDDMHRQAVVLASGEADLRAQVSQMFVTLSRRNTSLVNQQLGLIERLERDEEDPKRLESLFRLDHLAARMRRTADSLLILADAPPATAEVEGLTVTDALQAATSGVQDYQRVRIGAADATRIDESAGGDVVHLLTELVDNALTYSPPTSTVTVSARSTERSVVVEIVDAGLGIPGEQLVKINETLGSGGQASSDTARRMGLFVVSRLSQRHGITASLRANDTGGTTATVELPADILPDLDPVPAPEVSATPVAPPPPVVTPLQRPEPERSVGEPRPDRTPPPVKADGEKQVGMDLRARLEAARGTALGSPAAPPNGAAPGMPPVAPPPPVASVPAPPPPRPTLTPVANVSDLPSRRGAEPDQAGEPMAEVEDGTTDAGHEPETAVEAEPAAEPEETRTERESEPAREPAADLLARSEPAAKVQEDPPAQAKVSEMPEPAAVPHAPAADAPTPAPAAAGALDGAWEDTAEEGFDTPIFRSLRSAWLSSGEDAQPWRSSEIEAGWELAEEAVEKQPEPEATESGLPRRRPGTRLVPGGVTPAPKPTVRDPEAIRARLAAHASGVSRGRAAAGADPDPSLTEAGP
jgi:signal transduction histidine kinase